MRACSIYLKEERIFIVADGLTVEGFCVATEPYLEIDAEADDRQLGKAVLEVLAGDRRDLPQTEFTDGGEKIPIALGFKTWSALERNARYLHTERKGDEVIVSPYRRVKAHFSPILGAEARGPARPETVGGLIRELAELCTT